MLKIKNFCQLPLLAVFSLVISGCSYQKPDYLKMISPAELNQLMQTEDVFLMDVHTPRQRHIKGTDLFIPYNEVEAHAENCPLTKVVLFICIVLVARWVTLRQERSIIWATLI